MLNKNEYTINLDHLEIFFNGPDIFKKEVGFNFFINDSNTSSAYIEYKDLELQYKIITPQNYLKGFTFSFVYQGKIIDAFNVAFGDNTREVKTKNKITFYASFMVVYGNDFILNLINDIFETYNFENLRRFDIACDIPEKKENLIKNFKGTPTTELNFNKEKQEFETYYFGSRKGNKVLIRIYDKILDTFKKKKQFLYNFKETDYLTRFEVEIGQAEIKNLNNFHKGKINYKSLLSDKKLLENLFYTYAIKYNTFFASKEFTEYKIKHITPKILDLQNHYLEFKKLPKWWKQNGIGTSKKLIEVIGLLEFLKLTYDINDVKSIENVIEGLINHIKSINKRKINKKIKIIKNKPLDLENKIELIEKIIDLIISNDNILSDEVFLQLEYTLQKKF